LALENIARIQKYPCANRQSGCIELFSIEHISEHQAVCVYGEIKCPFKLNVNCSWKGLKSDLKEHAKAAHKVDCFELPSVCSSLFEGKFVKLLSCLGELFVQYRWIRDGRYYTAVQLIGTSSEASKYKCVFTLRAANGIEQISKTFLVQGYSEDFETTFNSGKYFCLDKAAVRDFLDGKNESNLTATLSRVH
jgi:hypothetical protein